MDNSVYNWMKEWVEVVNETPKDEDFWIETPIGDFKNPKFIPSNNDDINEVTITIKYEEWTKK